MTLSEPRSCRLAIRSEACVLPPDPAAAVETPLLEAWFVAPHVRDDAAWRDPLKHWVQYSANSPAQHPVMFRAGELQIAWNPGRAWVACPPSQMEAVWSALLEFSRLEAELSEIEGELRAAWPGLEEDTPLAYDVDKRDLARDGEIGARARRALQLRMRHARLEPLLGEISPRISPPISHLAEALREGTGCEARLEAADGQIEVLEYVYELASQRLGEYRNMRGTFVTESIIIVLLAAEVALMLWEVWSR